MGKKDKNVWTSKVGRDCVSLDTSLCRWLGKRLSHLATHSTGVPVDYIDMCKAMSDDDRDEKFYHNCWKREMSAAGEALTLYGDMFKNSGADNSPVLSDGQDAMRWVAKWLPNLWD
jgi:hypothetical protein